MVLGGVVVLGGFDWFCGGRLSLFSVFFDFLVAFCCGFFFFFSYFVFMFFFCFFFLFFCFSFFGFLSLPSPPNLVAAGRPDVHETSTDRPADEPP